jgi:hypothetical protein
LEEGSCNSKKKNYSNESEGEGFLCHHEKDVEKSWNEEERNDNFKRVMIAKVVEELHKSRQYALVMEKLRPRERMDESEKMKDSSEQ